MKQILFIPLFLFLQSVMAVNLDTIQRAKFKNKAYISEYFIQLLQTTQRGTGSIKTLVCGDQVKVYHDPQRIEDDFFLVQHNKNWGYVERKYVSQKYVTCFQHKYSLFFKTLVKEKILTWDDIYYWGEFYNEVEIFNTQVKD